MRPKGTGRVLLNFPNRMANAALAAVMALAASAFLAPSYAAAGPAIGQFELKDLEAEPGRVEFQSQNAHSWGQPRRKVFEESADETLYDDNSVARQRHALEMEASFTHFLRMRVGIEYEKERLDEPDDIAFANAFSDLKLDEIALEVVTIFKRVPEAGGVGFGALVEFEHPLEAGELNTILFGPIVEIRSGAWGAVGNLTFVHHFGNGERGAGPPERDQKWDLAYAAQLSYQFNETWTLALEAYGTFDRIGSSGTPGEESQVFGDHDQHRAGPLIYYAFSPGRGAQPVSLATEGGDNDAEKEGDEVEVSLGVGMLFGLNDNTPDQTLKWSIEVEF